MGTVALPEQSGLWESAAWVDPSALSDQEKGPGLVNRRVRIWWDGDNTYYEGRVVSYVEGSHKVVYLGDTVEYSEDLSDGSQRWQACVDEGLADREAEALEKKRSEEQARAISSANGSQASLSKTPSSGFLRAASLMGVSSAGRATYTTMAKVAILALGDPKTGCTLPAIRKKIADDNPETASKAKASFNNLTLKALTKLVSEGVLIKMKNSYKFSPQFIKEEESKAQRRGSDTSIFTKQQGGSETGDRNSVYGRFERNKRIRAELESSRKRRNALLQAHKSVMMPFMPDGDHFFTKLERDALLRKLSGKGCTVPSAAGDPGSGGGTAGSASGVFNPSHEIEFKVLPVTTESVIETLARLDLVKRDMVAPHLPPVTLQGRLCSECPPLQLSGDGWPVMEDVECMDTMITESGPFEGYRIVWPGKKLLVDDVKILTAPASKTETGTSLKLGDKSWEYVYYLEKPGVNGEEPLRTTALRLESGAFETHRTVLMKQTQAYAKRGNVPVLNLFTFQCRDPRTGEMRHITRQFCSDPWFGSVYKRLVRDTLRRKPSLMSIISELVPNAIKSVPDNKIEVKNQQGSPEELGAGEGSTATLALNPSSGETVEAVTCSPDQSTMKHEPLPGHASAVPEEGASAAQSPPKVKYSTDLVAEWIARAHAPIQKDILSQGPQAVVQYYSDLLSAAAALPVPGVLLSTVEARLQHAIKALESSNPKLHDTHDQPKTFASGSTDAISPVEDSAGAQLKDEELFDAKDALKGVKQVSCPPTITAQLHTHQIEGLSWLVHMYQNGMPGILGDQMGLGKTLQSISFMAYLRDSMGVSGPHLVVVPLSVLSNWMTEIERFCPSLRAVRFHGPREERNRIKTEELRDMAEFDVVVTTYEMLAAESNFFRRSYLWRLLIVDEGHRLKNEKSQLAQKLKQVPAYSRTLLTGTPLQNNLRELWALLHFLLPDVFTAACAAKFEAGFDLGRGVCDRSLLRAARQLLSIIMLRRVKDQIDIPLPPRTEIQILVKLSPMQHALYKHLLVSQDKSMLDAIMHETDVASQGGSSAPAQDTDYRKLLNLLLQLRKVCNHPLLLNEFSNIGDQNLVASCGKLVLLERMLPLLKADGHRVLIFTQFTSMLDILEEFLSSKSYEYVRLDGETNRVQRRLDIRRFNQPGSPLFIFLISTRAGGLGINLATADTVILYDSDWNPQADLQAMERAHRIGQVKPVRVYRLVSRGSVEERMVSRAEKKLFLNAMVAEQNGPGSEDDQGSSSISDISGAMSKKELASVIRFGASAVFEKEDDDLTDLDLDVLLGRSAGHLGNKEDDGDVSSSSALLNKGARALEEVDLRQLEGIAYEKQEEKSSLMLQQFGNDSNAGEDWNLGSEKRSRKSRVVMIDGSGAGLQGKVAVLADLMSDSGDEASSATAPTPKRNRRAWDHQLVCVLCNTGDARGTGEDLIKCSHCPRALHISCMNSVGARYSHSGNFTCPQHRCIGCDRNTTSAGGLLFRCCSCISSFCEDCLPEEDVESLGRLSEMEALGYYAKQAYWIRCETCCEGTTANEMGGEEEEEEGEEEEEEEEGGGEGSEDADDGRDL